jgi:hypothetical protein
MTRTSLRSQILAEIPGLIGDIATATGIIGDREYELWVTHTIGPRYLRISLAAAGGPIRLEGQRTTYAFVDLTNGCLLKATDNEHPDPIPRGNLLDPLDPGRGRDALGPGGLRDLKDRAYDLNVLLELRAKYAPPFQTTTAARNARPTPPGSAGVRTGVIDQGLAALIDRLARESITSAAYPRAEDYARDARAILGKTGVFLPDGRALRELLLVTILNNGIPHLEHSQACHEADAKILRAALRMFEPRSS